MPLWPNYCLYMQTKYDMDYVYGSFDLVVVAVVRRLLSALPDIDHIRLEVGTPMV